MRFTKKIKKKVKRSRAGTLEMDPAFLPGTPYEARDWGTIFKTNYGQEERAITGRDPTNPEIYDSAEAKVIDMFMGPRRVGNPASPNEILRRDGRAYLQLNKRGLSSHSNRRAPNAVLPFFETLAWHDGLPHPPALNQGYLDGSGKPPVSQFYNHWIFTDPDVIVEYRMKILELLDTISGHSSESAFMLAAALASITGLEYIYKNLLTSTEREEIIILLEESKNARDQEAILAATGDPAHRFFLNQIENSINTVRKWNRESKIPAAVVKLQSHQRGQMARLSAKQTRKRRATLAKLASKFREGTRQIRNKRETLATLKKVAKEAAEEADKNWRPWLLRGTKKRKKSYLSKVAEEQSEGAEGAADELTRSQKRMQKRKEKSQAKKAAAKTPMR